MTIKDASVWASNLLGKNVTPSNISYLIQYGRIPRVKDNGASLIKRRDLEDYYNLHYETKEQRWKKQLGGDLNWRLSFEEYKESQTTKHVHRLHPYKGKFIPQLVEYFLDQHTDDYKNKPFFKSGDIILDPFCGSGTTLVQANELNLHAVGIDISAFNAFISNAKVAQYDIDKINKTANAIVQNLINFQKTKNNVDFEICLSKKLKIFNNQFFPSPDYRRWIKNKQINEKFYGDQKSSVFLKEYCQLIKKYNISLLQNNNQSFLDKWFLQIIRDEIDFVFEQIKTVKDSKTKKALSLILSRTIRSCRATTHADLGTLKDPVAATYYCKKHGKICKPLFSILSWWKRYAQDTVKRLKEFNHLKTNSLQECLVGDSQTLNIMKTLEYKNPALARLIGKNKIKGIFSSPPYVGLIDYHEQHAYAYDLLGFNRNDELEIGPLYKGQSIAAQQSYIKSVAEVLTNCKPHMAKNYHVFLVANDKYDLYPQIAKLSKMKIVNSYKRPVLNRVEKDRSAYAEIIFHMREQ